MSKNENFPDKVFLFILDCVRKDHLGLYGYKRNTSPNIDKLSDQSEVYNWAISPSSYTHAAIPSILSGKYPFELSNQFINWQFTNKDLKQLDQIKKLGYKLVLFTAHIATSTKNSNLGKYFDYIHDELTGSETNRDFMLVGQSKNIIKSLTKYIDENKKQKMLIIVHLMEAHGPYEANYNSIFLNDRIYKKDKRKIERVVFDDFRGVTDDTLKNKVMPRYMLYQPIYDSDGNIEDFNPFVNNYVAHYDMGIYEQDRNLGKFFDYLKEKNLYDRSTIAITSDHGELIGEDNIFFSHGIYTHPSLINVPLIIKRPYQQKKVAVKNNFNNRLLIPHLLKRKLMNINKWIQDGLLSFTSQSFSLLKDNYLIMVHNGKYQFSESINESFFPSLNFEPKDTIENYLNFKINFRLNIFKKRGNGFLKINEDTQYVSDIIKIFLEINKFSVAVIENQKENEIKELNKKITEYEKQYQQLLHDKNYLNDELARIYSSKTWRLLNFYKKMENKSKKIVLAVVYSPQVFNLTRLARRSLNLLGKFLKGR